MFWTIWLLSSLLVTAVFIAASYSKDGFGELGNITTDKQLTAILLVLIALAPFVILYGIFSPKEKK